MPCNRKESEWRLRANAQITTRAFASDQIILICCPTVQDHFSAFCCNFGAKSCEQNPRSSLLLKSSLKQARIFEPPNNNNFIPFTSLLILRNLLVTFLLHNSPFLSYPFKRHPDSIDVPQTLISDFKLKEISR